MRGDRLQQARERAGMTREELAEKVGKSYVTVGTWERGARKPKAGLDTARFYARAVSAITLHAGVLLGNIVSIQSHTSHVSLQHGHQMDTGLKLGKRKSPGLAGAVSNISLLSREANACLPQRQLFFCSLALRCAHRAHAFLHAFRPRQEATAAAAPTAPSHVPVPGIESAGGLVAR